ncbi:glycosyltransferase family 2 protein [Flavobacteriaceae bacterium F08102]|nr:glycosyltransferase family 2 protein [Flavobacteriaceae bacterium F08102]
MNVSIVILNWNGKSLLETFLPSVLQYRDGADVYVVDNASTDDSVTFLQTNFPEVTLIENNSNGGFAKGYNDALSKINADVYALVNSDVEVTEGWISSVVAYFKTHPEVAIIQPKIRDYKSKSSFEYAGAAGGFIDQYGYPYCKGRIFNTLEEDINQYNVPDRIFWASGACFFIRAKVFHQLNGFDEDYFAHQEEIDLCWRAFNAGYKCAYIPSSVIYHVGGATLDAANPKKTYLNFRNSLLTMLKNLPKNQLWSILISRLFLDGIAGLKFLSAFKFSHFLAVIRAHFSFYGMFPRYWAKRKDLLTKKTNYYNHRHIVWQYFIRGRKTFTSLKK